jgi:hypothetical protein
METNIEARNGCTEKRMRITEEATRRIDVELNKINQQALEHSSKTHLHRVLIVEKELTNTGRSLVESHVQALGRKARHPRVQRAILSTLEEIESKYRKKLFPTGVRRNIFDHNMPERFDRETVKIRARTLQDLDSAVRQVPTFFMRNRDKLIVGLLLAFFGALLTTLHHRLIP